MRSRPFGVSLGVVGVALLMATVGASAQESSPDIIPELRDRAIVLDIVARVVERDQEEVWNSESSKVTIPGRPVSIKLVGQNVVVAVQFTPYKGANGRQVLVAQGQVWVTSKEEGMHYQSTIQTIPMDFGERVYFFPLGPRKSDGSARIEIQIELRPYRDSASPPETTQIKGTTPQKVAPAPPDSPQSQTKPADSVGTSGSVPPSDGDQHKE